MRRLQSGIGRDQAARLMRLTGVRGRSRSKRIITTRRGLGVERFPDLVRRRRDREALDAVWVADFMQVRTLEGKVYVSFLQDACSRQILGFTIARRKTTDLVLKAVDQAVSVRSRVNPQFTGEGVIQHADAGSQYTSLALSDKLLEHRISGSIGRIGTAYDNALMESTIGLYKTGLIHADRKTWATRQEVESATVVWVSWFNRQRLHSSLDYLSPIESEAAYNHQQDLQRQAA